MADSPSAPVAVPAPAFAFRERGARLLRLKKNAAIKNNGAPLATKNTGVE